MLVSGGPALQTSNETVNQLKLDTNKASESNYWRNIRCWGRSIVPDRSQGLIGDLLFFMIFMFFMCFCWKSIKTEYVQHLTFFVPARKFTGGYEYLKVFSGALGVLWFPSEILIRPRDLSGTIERPQHIIFLQKLNSEALLVSSLS